MAAICIWGIFQLIVAWEEKSPAQTAAFYLSVVHKWQKSNATTQECLLAVFGYVCKLWKSRAPKVLLLFDYINTTRN